VLPGLIIIYVLHIYIKAGEELKRCFCYVTLDGSESSLKTADPRGEDGECKKKNNIIIIRDQRNLTLRRREQSIRITLD
jgi:ssDNA-binding Zn-finger/Zn-ribbon topoisomerase 1